MTILRAIGSGFTVFCLSLLLILGITITAKPVLAASSSAIRVYDIDTTQKNYVGQTLSQVEFGNADFTDADFSKANLQGAVFNGATLKNVSFRNVDFRDGIAYLTDFTGADLSDAIFDSTMLLRSNFRNVKVQGTDFSQAVIDRDQVKVLCAAASGINSVTGVDTRESLGCD